MMGAYKPGESRKQKEKREKAQPKKQPRQPGQASTQTGARGLTEKEFAATPGVSKRQLVETKRMFTHDVTQWGLDLTPEQSQKAQEIQTEIQAQKEGKKQSFFEEPSAIIEGWSRGKTLGMAAGIGATILTGGYLLSALKAGTTLAASGGLSAPAVTRLASGTIPRVSQFVATHEGATALIGTTVKGEAAYIASAIGAASQAAARSATAAITKFVPTVGRVTINTVTARKTITYLGKLVSGLKNPYVVLSILATGLYTSMFWAPNEKGDAMMTLGIVQGQAAKNEDWETVLEIDEQMQEANDIKAGLPIIGFTLAEKAKFEAGIIASETYAKQARIAMQETEGKIE